MSGSTATVEVLTAEVRVLMVGSRQVTLSVYRQLDWVSPREIEPFGRVQDPREVDLQGRIDADGEYRESVVVVGCDSQTGALARSEQVYHLLNKMEVENESVDANTGAVTAHLIDTPVEDPGGFLERENQRFNEWSELPLIVLAGLT